MDRNAFMASIKPRPARPVIHWRREGILRTRILPNCGFRGPETGARDYPCCHGKIRREFLFPCAYKSNAGATVTSQVCSVCLRWKEYEPCL